MLILNAMLLSEKLMISNCIFDVNYAFINLFDSSICSTLKFAVENFRCKLGCYTEVNLKFFFFLLWLLYRLGHDTTKTISADIVW